MLPNYLSLVNPVGLHCFTVTLLTEVLYNTMAVSHVSFLVTRWEDVCSPLAVILSWGHAQHSLEEPRLQQGEQGICGLVMESAPWGFSTIQKCLTNIGCNLESFCYSVRGSYLNCRKFLLIKVHWKELLISGICFCPWRMDYSNSSYAPFRQFVLLQI